VDVRHLVCHRGDSGEIGLDTTMLVKRDAATVAHPNVSFRRLSDNVGGVDVRHRASFPRGIVGADGSQNRASFHAVLNRGLHAAPAFSRLTLSTQEMMCSVHERPVV
jgi:hypothetical protein